MPPPDPRSSTTSPGARDARGVGLPHPMEAKTASAGSPAVWLWSYRSTVIGSRSTPQAQPQPQPVADPSFTWRAAAPYLSFTISRTVSGSIVGPALEVDGSVFMDSS